MKKRQGLLITTIVIAVILAVLAVGDWDYSISKAIINKESIFGEVFNLFGEIPAMFGMLLGVAILFGGRKKEVLWHNISGMIIALPFMALFSYMLVFMPVRYIYEFEESGIPKIGMVIVSVLAVIVFVSFLFGIKGIGNERLKKYRKHGLILLVLMVSEMIIVNVLKMVWARPRMRSIESIEQFKRWYEINGPLNSEEFKSFPSGHTANGFAMIAYTMFVPSDKAKFKRNLTVFAIAWGICTALSRVVLGAHFLSDVVVGGYITMVLFYLFKDYIFRLEP